jgi:hypothetical protein
MIARAAVATAIACAACEQGAPPPKPVVAPPVAPVTVPHGPASDDHEHLAAKLQPLLAPMQSCVPRADLIAEPEGEGYGDELELALDVVGNQLVVCAQYATRRGISVFFDPVSYACWNVDPANGHVARRADLARSYFDCQDGSCPPGPLDEVTSYDGASLLVFDGAGHRFTIEARDGEPIRSFAAPVELVEPGRGELVYVGHTILVIIDKTIRVLDDRGAARTTLAGTLVHVVDDDHVVVGGDDQLALYDLAANTSAPLGNAKYLTTAVRLGDALYEIDDNRRIFMFSAATFALRGSMPLPTCR